MSMKQAKNTKRSLTNTIKRTDLETHVYIDVSNIRSACERSCGFKIDFVRLYNYLKNKYPKLAEVRYYEGISRGDSKKGKYFDHLRSTGYKICTLVRKEYIDQARHKEVVCKKCGYKNIIQVLPRKIKLKSNVDVYLTSDMLECVTTNRNKRLHIVLLSCDGDYSEAICTLLRLDTEATVTVLATPRTRRNNCPSNRLTWLNNKLSDDKYRLMSINSIRDKIKDQTL